MIKMYNCHFGDCFCIEGKTDLVVDFGTWEPKKNKRESLLNPIIRDLREQSDFLLTHYHYDHYCGAVLMSAWYPNKKFRDIYIPDIWNALNSVEIVSLHLIADIMASRLNSKMSLLDFVQSIACRTGKLVFIKRGDTIQNRFIALWPASSRCGQYLPARPLRTV